ncbi:uncharacterized protein LOC111109513 [Crassostrea virginica]
MILDRLFPSIFFLNLCVLLASAACYYRAYNRRYYCYYRSYYYYNVSGSAVAGIVIGVLAFVGIMVAVFVIVCLKKCKGRTIGGRTFFGYPVSSTQTTVAYSNTVPQTTMFPQQTYPTTTLNFGMNPAPVTQYPFGPPPPQYGQLPPQYGQPPPIPGPSAYSAPLSAPTAPPTYSSMFNDNPPPGQKY